MGCLSCSCYNFSNGPIELVHGDKRLELAHRPSTFEDLLKHVFVFASEYEKPSDFTLEYVSYEGIKGIFHETSLQEAYIRYQGIKLLIGIKPSIQRSYHYSTLDTITN